jgi:hypothetical protein
MSFSTIWLGEGGKNAELADKVTVRGVLSLSIGVVGSGNGMSFKSPPLPPEPAALPPPPPPAMFMFGLKCIFFSLCFLTLLACCLEKTLTLDAWLFDREAELPPDFALFDIYLRIWKIKRESENKYANDFIIIWICFIMYMLFLLLTHLARSFSFSQKIY